MNLLKHLALGCYYYASLPRRRRMAALRAARHTAPVMVLFYHRVSDVCPNDWTISTTGFARQIDWLQQNFDLVSLGEAQRLIRAGNDRPAVSITFDDGYAENCAFALPLLAERKIPATYFVAAEHVLKGKPFPHDVAAGAPLRPNTIEELKRWSAAGIEIGAHTRTHADLGKVSDGHRLYDELVTSRQDLELAIGAPLRYFAFPYGLHANMSAEAFALARDVGYAGVCSAYGGYNFPGDDSFHLQRIHGDPELLRLKNWLTVDPRKLRSTERYVYESPRTSAPLEIAR